VEPEKQPFSYFTRENLDVGMSMISRRFLRSPLVVTEPLKAQFEREAAELSESHTMGATSKERKD